MIFAAVAAVAALLSIMQARALHKDDAADRALDRGERREQFERESEERRQNAAAELRTRQLEQLGRISDLVATVRETARREAVPEGRMEGMIVSGGAYGRGQAMFFWNARKQLELGLATFRALGGAEALPACHDLATGSTMNNLTAVIARSTDSFDELARAATERVEQAASG